jgi:hypothetical protein
MSALQNGMPVNISYKFRLYFTDIPLQRSIGLGCLWNYEPYLNFKSLLVT